MSVDRGTISARPAAVYEAIVGAGAVGLPYAGGAAGRLRDRRLDH
ncbi:hypothetical protein [Streptomyces sp. SLBN-31]|nr:hypothetical protein [Streptomyces sp. SLBN-31]